MKRSFKGVLITSVAMAMFAAPVMSIDSGNEKGNLFLASVQAKETTLTKRAAVQLAAQLAQTKSVVQMGGIYKRGEIKTFTYKGKTYRYLASTIDTKKEMVAYLEKVMSPKMAKRFYDQQHFIVHRGKLAQLEADGGSLLQWAKATATFVKGDAKSAVYELKLPVADTGEFESFTAQYEYVASKGWRFSQSPFKQEGSQFDETKAKQMAMSYASVFATLQAGGLYKEGEYKTFQLNNKTYRYLASSIDSKNELMAFLNSVMTRSLAEQTIADFGIIEHNGKLAQVEADGGSLLDWSKAEIELFKETNGMKIFHYVIPVGETSKKEMQLIDFIKEGDNSWKINRKPYMDLNVPGNIHPGFLLFHVLMQNPEGARDQFIDPTSMDVSAFTKGVQQIQYESLIEVSRTEREASYIVEFTAKLDSSYKGDLMEGMNRAYMTVRQTDFMEFKIDEFYVMKKVNN